ncbi:hypothetical protein [Staphylococcus aureus]|uniref:hypothetical protein n=1 Tax=Staphylococcus aureus TaxID=1280 RepID=UPI002026FCED|nr:hypothetical protein [Staphylococcus aureus]MCL9742922.1 hypothetical protein [Staphylococcus aureus]
MEQITLTKEELKEIIAKEVREAINGKKPISSGAIFNKVRISHKDFDEINKKFAYTERLRGADNLGFESIHQKVYVQDVHDHIRKLTLSIFGVTLNSDLSESEYNLAAKIYRDIKNYYLYIYEKRVSELTIDDFE